VTDFTVVCCRTVRTKSGILDGMMGRFAEREERRLMLKTFSGLLLLAASITIMAQTPAFDSDAKTFRLDGGNVSYVFGVNPPANCSSFTGADAWPRQIASRKPCRCAKQLPSTLLHHHAAGIRRLG